MRYAYDNEAISFVNRVYNAVDGPANPKIWETPGVSSLAATLWFEADKKTDWGGEGDVLFEEVPFIDAIFGKAFVSLPTWDNPETGEKRHPLWDVYEEVEKKIGDFENKVWLAALVFNAMRALEADLRTIWSLPDGGATDAYIAEFKKERDSNREYARSRFAKFSITSLGDEDKEIREVIEKYLEMTDDEIKAERRAKFPKPEPIAVDAWLKPVYGGSTVLVKSDDGETSETRKALVRRKGEVGGDVVVVIPPDYETEYEFISDEMIVYPG